MSKPILETHHLTKTYGRDRGIVDVNLVIEEGEIFGFIGPNGAGKSTAIRTLLNLIFPTSGSATIFGQDIIVDGPKIREHIGYLPSEVFYYDNMRAIDLLAYSASFYRIDQRSALVRIHELAQLLDLDLNKKIEDLSYGNRKKVGIIQGLVHRPKLIILDEPTGGLDPLIQQKFFNLLREENRRGATILFSSHILSEVQHLCDRVAIIKDGRIIKVEKISELLEHNYKRFKLELAGDQATDQLTKLAGVSEYKRESRHITFLYRGQINDILRQLARLDLVNLWVEEPDLEEIFMHYYQ